MVGQRMLIISAHPGDFLRGGAGVIRKYRREGAAVYVIVLSEGLRSEGIAGLQEARAKADAQAAVRRAEVMRAAAILDIEHVEFCGYDDNPLEMDRERLRSLACRIREIHPDFILTHDAGRDIRNPDHERAARAVLVASAVASSPSVRLDGLPAPAASIPLFGFEPLHPEASAWVPGVLVDITADYETKELSLSCLASERESLDISRQQARNRAVHCAGRGGVSGCEYAEAFSAFGPICSHDALVW